LKIIAGEDNSEKIQLVDKSPFPFEESKIKDLAKKSQISTKEISFGIDLVRTNRNGNQIILKRTDFPLKSFSVNTESVVDVKTLYYGFIEVPFQIYNPEKMNLFNQSNKSNNKSFYSVYVIPIAKEKNNYSLELIISQGDNGGNYSYSKKIELAVGEKINIELQSDNWRYEEVVKGERMKLNSEEDYNKYVKDYLILSLEDDKAINVNKNLSSNRETNNKARYVETRTNEDRERDIVKNELQSLSKVAVDDSYSTNRNIRYWQIPSAFRRQSIGIYRIIKLEDGIEIEGVGRAIGNDKVSPVRSTIRVLSRRKNVTNHIVKSGESIGNIASKYGVTVTQLKSWNNLRSSKLTSGRSLIIYDSSKTNNLTISQVEVKN
ncbi:MAG: LysM peptidoglycan-binding domain-containing protein, partial [Ignavibacteria bacterium]|nr:LysM peptidoglycan-binding domain-containing protein [Ignavibacteria bacterium]